MPLISLANFRCDIWILINKTFMAGKGISFVGQRLNEFSLGLYYITSRPNLSSMRVIQTQPSSPPLPLLFSSHTRFRRKSFPAFGKSFPEKCRFNGSWMHSKYDADGILREIWTQRKVREATAWEKPLVLYNFSVKYCVLRHYETTSLTLTYSPALKPQE